MEGEILRGDGGWKYLWLQMKLVENARSEMHQFLCLYIAISTVLKQHFQLVQFHLNSPSIEA